MIYNDRLIKFINEFVKLLNTDKYISKKIIDNFYDKNNILLYLDN